jgi:hypothetical protein
MKIIININTENAAFEDNPCELENILAGAILKMKTEKEGNLRDSNGNKVGNFKVTGK